MKPILLDTCAAIWLSRGEIAPPAAELLNQAEATGASVLLSPISAWEVATLAARGRLALATSPARWFQLLLDEGLSLCPTPWPVLVESASLPGAPLRDPADRILAATARAVGYQLMTRDKPLLEYAAAGWISAVRC